MSSRQNLWAGAIAGSSAGIVMAGFMMMYMAAAGRSIWTNPNLIAAMWLGGSVANGAFGVHTVVGFMTHLATSALLGIVGVPFISSLSSRRTMLAAFTYTVASYPIVVAFVMSWADPVFVERTSVVPMTIAHGLFGFVYGGSYLWMHRGSPLRRARVHVPSQARR